MLRFFRSCVVEVGKRLSDLSVVISLFTYTLLVAASTWAAFTFVFKDNEINQAKAESGSLRSSLEQYRSKAELLQKEVDNVRAENAEYRAWLEKTKEPLPLIVPELVALRNKVALLSREPAPDNQQPSDPTPPASGRPTPEKIDSGIEISRSFSLPRSTRIGNANHDATTGLVVATANVGADRTAQLRITAPGEDTAKTHKVYAGSRIGIPWGKRRIQLTVLEINWYTDTVTYELKVLPI